MKRKQEKKILKRHDVRYVTFKYLFAYLHVCSCKHYAIAL